MGHADVGTSDEYYRRGREAFQRGEFRSARQALEDGVRQRGDSRTYDGLLGAVLLIEEDIPAGMAALRRAFERDPGDAPTRAWLASGYIRAGQPSEAEALLGPAAVASEAERSRCTISVGRALLRQGAFKEAASWIQGAIAKLGESPDLMCDLAQALVVGGDTARAEAVLHRALDLAPQHAASAIFLAGLLEERGEPQEALRIVEGAAAGAGENAALLAAVGGSYQALGRYHAALRQYEAACRLEPQEAAYHLGRGAALLSMARPRGARAAAGRARRLLERRGSSQGPLAAVWSNLSAIAAHTDDLSGAEAAATRAVEVSRREPYGYAALAGVRAVQCDEGGVRAAVQELREHCAISPADLAQHEAEAYALLAWAFVWRYGVRDAVWHARRAWDLGAESAEALHYVGCGLALGGWLREAEGPLASAARLVPAAPNSWAMLAYSCLRRGSVTDADGLVAQAEAAGAPDALMRYATGVIHHALGQHREALTQYEIGCKLDPKDAGLHIGRGKALSALGETRAARRAASRAERVLLRPEGKPDPVLWLWQCDDLVDLMVGLADLRGAGRVATRLAEAAPQVAWVHGSVARVREAAGRRGAALSAVRQAHAAYGTPSDFESLAELAEHLGSPDDAERLRKRAAEIAAELPSERPPS